MTILFLHGWHSTPGGTKPTFLAQHGHTVINPRLPDEDFEEAVRIAQSEFDKHEPQVVVGSSRGGAVAMNINSGNAKLVLLCPGWKTWGNARTVKPGTVILHSRADDVVPFAHSEELVKNSGLPASALIEVGSDHRLADPDSLVKMLEACENSDNAILLPRRMEPPMTPDPEPIDLSKLRPGPIRHESLPPEMLEQIKAVYDVIGQYLDTTLEQFEIGFMRDMHPESEVAVWCSITAAWLAYHEKFLGDEVLPDEDERKMLGALITISTGVKDLEKLGVPVEVGQRLLACYDGLSSQ